MGWTEADLRSTKAGAKVFGAASPGTATRHRRRREEEILQRSSALLIQLLKGEGPNGYGNGVRAYRGPKILVHEKLCFHVPNESISKARGAIMKAMGAEDGVPDWLLGYPPVAAELKAPSGRLSKSQKRWRDQWQKLGGKYVVVFSMENFVTALLMSGVLSKASLGGSLRSLTHKVRILAELAEAAVRYKFPGRG